MATVLGMIDCPGCLEKAEVREAKGGTLQIFHQACTQGFVKSPAAVAKLRARLAGTPPAAPAADAPSEKKGGKGGFFDLDLGNL